MEANVPSGMEQARATLRAHLAAIGLDVTQISLTAQGRIAGPPPQAAVDALAALPELAIADDGELVLGKTLGQGGMGVVRSALQRSIGRQVAVKMVMRDGDDVTAIELMREATVTGRLEHPSIVPVYALGRDKAGRPAFVMKRIEGRPWSEALDADRPRLPGDRERLAHHLGVLMQVARALAFAHARAIVHRDVKPDNVMLGEFGEVYLVDWGLAVCTGDDPLLPRAADVCTIAGTPGYLAPEMAAAEGAAIDARTDVYLLGAVLHEIIAGAPPHLSATLEDTLALALRGEPPRYFDAVPDELAAIAARAMSLHPDDRFAGVEAMRAALASFLDHASSRELCAAGERRAGELERAIAGQTGEPHRLFTEARFAFEQALGVWPDNERARALRRRLIERMARYELGRENRDAAAALIAETGNEELEAGLAELDRILAGRRAELEALIERDADRDVAVRADDRRRFALLLAALVVVVTAAMSAVQFLGAPFGYPVLILGNAVMLSAVALAWRAIARRPVHDVTRRFIGSVGAVMTFLGLHLVIALLVDMPFSHGFALTLLLIAVGTSVGGATLHRWFFLSSALYLCGFVAMEAWPGVAIATFAFFQMLGFLSMALVWWRASRPEPAISPRSSSTRSADR